MQGGRGRVREGAKTNPEVNSTNLSDLAKPQEIGTFGLAQPPEIHLEFPGFTGSLALLFQCVKDRQLDLLGVPLAPVCEAYLRYVLESADHDLESAAVALAGLAYLIERKAWLLLPVDQEPEGDELLEVLQPYIDQFRPAIDDLRNRAEERESLFFRSPDGADAYELPIEYASVTVADLSRALERLLARAKPDEEFDAGTKPQRSLSEMMIVVMRALPDDFKPLDEIVTAEFTRSEVVWWFLALLELIRLGQARVVLKDGDVLFKQI